MFSLVYICLLSTAVTWQLGQPLNVYVPSLMYISLRLLIETLLGHSVLYCKTIVC